MTQGPTRHGEVERVLDAIVESYSGVEEINNLESAALPNKRAVIDAFNHLKPIIYMGFYSTRPLHPDNLRYAISEHLYPAHEILVEQIGRAVTYEERTGRRKARGSGFSEDAVLRLFAALPAIRRTLNRDVVAAQEGDPAAQSIEEVIFSYPAIQAITAYRIARVLHLEGVPMIPRIISEYAHSQTGIDIHPGAQIGERFFIDHGTGVVVGATCVIGNNVKLYQSVTLGALSLRGSESAAGRSKKRHPTLEDDVTIYSGATILGGETVIGRGSVIGGNVWLVHSVPPNSKILYEARNRDG
jgi:serine O-acetyltransferase